MGLESLVGSTAQNGPMFLGNEMFQPGPGQPITGPAKGPGGPLLIDNNSLGPGGNFFGGPYKPPGFSDFIGLPPLEQVPGGPGYGGGLIGVQPPNGNFIGLQPPMFGGGLQPMPQPVMPDYSSQFDKFGEQLTGFGDQMTGYQDALGSFNEQVGGMGKQFETINNRLDSVDKGLGSLGNQIASFENMQKAQPSSVMQPQQQQQQSYSPFGFGGFGGLASLFGGYF